MPRRCSFLSARVSAILSLILILVIHAFAASKARVLHTFHGGEDGGRPWATLLLDDKTGTLYGTTEDGGNQSCSNYFDTGCGTIFSLSPSGKGWKETILYRFQGGSDGGNPRAPLVPRPDGYFYSTTTTGGDSQSIGTAFRIQPGTWKEEVIFRFPTREKGGAYPQGAIAFDRKGNLYGLTPNGGSTGVAFELISKPVGEWKEVVLYDNVGLPYAGMVFDHDGNLYGTTDSNGIFNEGSVFELSDGKLGWQFTNLYSFQDPAGVGVQPSDLTADKQGNLFGFAGDAGIVCYPHPYSCGTVFEMTRVHGTWQEKTLYQFKDVADGWGPGYGAPAFDRAGNLYGTTGGGGKYGFGTVFQLSPVKGGWRKTTLYNFPGGAGGVEPIGGLVVDRQGNVFGTTYFGGGGTGKCKQQGCGIVFEITP